MTWVYCKNCGVDNVTYPNLPVYGVIGNGVACPSHGSIAQTGDGSPFGMVCRKCGLIQFINGVPVGAIKKNKFNGNKCTDCNRPLADEPHTNYYSCVRCGRAYNSFYAKKTSSNLGAPIKCPHCGGNTLFV